MLKARYSESALLALALFYVVFATAASGAEATDAREVEYLDATVLLIDHKEGSLGVTITDEKTGVESKKALNVDIEEVYVSDPAGRDLDFEQVAVGDHVDLYALADKSGKERVVDIVDYSRMHEE